MSGQSNGYSGGYQPQYGGPQKYMGGNMGMSQQPGQSPWGAGGTPQFTPPPAGPAYQNPFAPGGAYANPGRDQAMMGGGNMGMSQQPQAGNGGMMGAGYGNGGMGGGCGGCALSGTD